MAPGVDLIHLQVLDDNGDGNFAAIESALQWVIDNGWTRVNSGISPGGQADYTGVDEGGNRLEPESGLLDRSDRKDRAGGGPALEGNAHPAPRNDRLVIRDGIVEDQLRWAVDEDFCCVRHPWAEQSMKPHRAHDAFWERGKKLDCRAGGAGSVEIPGVFGT